MSNCKVWLITTLCEAMSYGTTCAPAAHAVETMNDGAL